MILVEPDPLGSRSHIGIVTMHSDGNYLSVSNCIPPAQRGYRALCMNNQFTNNPDNIEVFFSNRAGYRPRCQPSPRPCGGATVKSASWGHSMGGPLIAFYQNALENGPAVWQGPSDDLSMP